jgi:uncharacterized membrane protein YuzA (DUF378 family)
MYKKGSLNCMDKFALVLVIVGALNWLLVGLFQYDLVASLFGGQDALLSRVIYTLVGVAGIWCISLLFRERDKAATTDKNRV